MSDRAADRPAPEDQEEATVRREVEVHTRRMSEIRAMSPEALDDLRRDLIATAETAWPSWVVLARCGALQELARIDAVCKVWGIKAALAQGRTAHPGEPQTQPVSTLERELARLKGHVRVNALLLSRNLGTLLPA